jgi:hypothetical protein
MPTVSHHFILLTSAVVLSAIAYQAVLGAPAKQAKQLAAVDRVEFAAQAVAPEQVCPTVVRFRGRITATTEGLVRYRLRSDTGTLTTPSYNLVMKAKEVREIHHLRQVGQVGDRTVRVALVLEVTTDKGVQTAKASFDITCVSSPREGQDIVSLASTVRQGASIESRDGEHEDLLEGFGAQYLERRGYSVKNPFDDRRLKAYDRLREMRRALDKPHRPAGWLDSPIVPPSPSTVDASQCAWSSVGPTNINGRVTQIAIDPTNHQRLFLTSVGGIWRSVDGARRWQRVSDEFLSSVAGSVAVNPSNPTEIFAGGGDPNWHSGWGGGLGIWRSTANGDRGSWVKVSPSELDSSVVYRLRIDPTGPNNVYAATSNGVYIGTRSGGSITFARLAGFDGWASDLVVDFSSNPPLVYAGVRQSTATYGNGIWKYDGTTWLQRNTGIPTASSRTISLALAPSNPLVLYAKVESNTAGLQGVYKTTTAAETPSTGGNAWDVLPASAVDDSDGYSWYNSVIEVDPDDPNTIWVGGINIWRSTDGGTTWNTVNSGTDNEYPLGVHPDNHAVAFDPTNSKIVYVGSDGGIFRTSDMSLTKWRWNNVSHGILTAQFFHATSQQALAGIVAGGTQDNGILVSFGNRTWHQPVLCDGYDVGIDAADASTLYANCNSALYELTNPVPGTVGGTWGSNWATWTLPAGITLKGALVTDSSIAGAALAAGTDGTLSRLLKTTDGLNWTNASPTLGAGSIVSAIGIAPSSGFEAFYLASSDGEIWRTVDGGTNWAQTSVGLSPTSAWIYAIYVDPANPARAVTATSNGIFLTVDTGAHWDSIGGGGTTALPTAVVTGAVLDPNDANVVYAATDVGVFRGTITAGASPSASWTPFDEGLPDGLDISDIWVNRSTAILKIASMGHGAFQRDIRPGLTCPSAQLVVRDNVVDRGGTPSPSGVPDPEHPIPDPARPGFYKPDDTVAGRLNWWSSTDVRIDVPSAAPVKNQIASADHVEFESCPIHLSDCPAGTIRDADPQRGQVARVYAQVNNMGLQPAVNVRVTALFADASVGLPMLPADFWTTTVPPNSTTCGPLTGGSGWQFVDPANPCPMISVVNPELPEVARFDWSVPVGQAGHSCILIIVESVSDPLDPNVRATNERRIDVLVPNNRQISLRNLHVVDTHPARAGSPPHELEIVNVSNPSRELRQIDLLVSRVDLARGEVVGFLLPAAQGVEAKGAQIAKIALSNEQRRLVQELRVNATAFYRVVDPREAEIRLPVPPGQTWHIGLVYPAGTIRSGTAARISIIARQERRMLGGSTYIIRSSTTKP